VNEIEKHLLDGCVIESSLAPQFLEGFFDLLHQKIHSKPNRYLFLAIYPKHTYYQQEFITADNIKLLEPLVDGFSLMTYDYSRGAGPNAPIEWIEDNVKHLDPEGLYRAKILIGLNMYGYGFIGDEGSVLTGSQYLQIVERYDPEFEWDDDAQEHEFTYKASSGSFVRVFYPTLKVIP
jgi:chitinase domain-containing protein 1